MWTFLRKKMKLKTGTFVEASASEYLAITGAGIDGDLKLAKTWLLRPGQHCSRFSIAPRNYAFNVRAMSNDEVTFRLPTVLTIGPNISAATGDFCNNGAADEPPLHRYAKLIALTTSGESRVRAVVEGVVKDNICVHATELTMEEILAEGAQEFRNWVKRVFREVQADLKADFLAEPVLTRLQSAVRASRFGTFNAIYCVE